MGQSTIYAHDINDRITGVTAPLTNTTQAVTQYSYDDLGNQLQEVSPDRGTRTYTYDAAGNVLSVTDVLPRTTSYTYDALNRILTQQSSVTSTPRYTYLYDGCGLGRLCMIQQNGNFHLYFAYDGLGRQNFEMSNNYIASAYVYSPAGRLAQITTYPGGRTVDYLRNSAGQVTTVQTTDDAGVTTPLAQNIDHYPFGPLFYLSLGGTPTYYLHDTAYRINYELSTPWLSYLTRDPNGNILSRNTFNGGGTQGFTYDALDRLTQATDSASTYPALGYSYDANGNRLSETRASTTTNYGYQSSTNKLAYQGFEARLTNPAGETIYTTTLGTLTYDGYGRLTQIGTTTYTYDALNRRQRKTNSSNATTTLFHYLPTGELLIESQAGATQQHVYLDSRPLARIDGNQLYYYHTDNLGTPRALTDSNGTTVWLATYEPFGNATVIGSITNNLRMAGQYYDQETGLHYNNARYYDPRVGRYISSDPIGLAGGLNTYSYVYNNPLMWVDPDGLQTAANSLAGDALINPDAHSAAADAIAEAIGKGAAGLLGKVCVGASLLLHTAPYDPNVAACDESPKTCPANVTTKNPFEGEPGTWSSNGNQDRLYGQDGYPEVDIDRGHDHGAGDPHAHNWDRPSGGGRPTADNRGPGAPMSPVPNPK